MRIFDVEGDDSTPKEEHFENMCPIVRDAKRELDIHKAEMTGESKRLIGDIENLVEHLQKNIECLNTLKGS